jgi:hypothetical protein
MADYKLLTATVKFVRFDILFDLFDRINEKLLRSIDREAARLATYIKKQHLSGGPGGLRARSGELRRRTFSLAPIRIGYDIIGRVVIGSGLDYTHIHVGPAGQTTTIFPKKAKALAIPLPSAMTGGGRLLSVFMNKTSLWDLHPRLFRGNKKHNLRPDILYYKRGNSIMPMFLLRRSVTIRTKVWPEQIAASQGPSIENRIIADMVSVTARLQ